MKLCDYGCGQEARIQFKEGKWCCSKSHNSCPEVKAKNRKSNTGKSLSQETKRKISDVHKGKSNGMKGHHHSEKTKKTYSLMRSKENNPMFGKSHTKESINKMKENSHNSGENNGMFGKYHTVESKRIIGEKSKLYYNRQEVKAETSRMFKNFWFKLSDLEKEKYLSKIFKSCEMKPNKLEILLNSVIESASQNQFKYTGDGQVWIGGKNPDWININGKKQLIEFFGSYWHKKEDEEVRKEHFKKYGYDCLVIWEAEFKDIEQLKMKVKNYLLC
jgi:hypothetical protein